MKNKKVTVFLLLALIVIWGMVMYQVIVRINADNKTGKMPSGTQTHPVLTGSPSQSFDLLLNYRDPFLKTMQAPSAGASSVTVKLPVEKKAPVVQVDWSGIVYLGRIINPKTQKKVSLLLIKGREYMMKDGQTEAGLTLIRNYGDSVKVSYDKQLRYLKK